jgi:CRP-like cAMP-binding protein
MPKIMQYTPGSIVYFEGDRDERIFILKSGSMAISETDIETGEVTSSLLNSGEFFGSKSALGHFPREETVKAMTPSVAIAMTVPEFEAMFSNNQALIVKMLRVFSTQLRLMHKKAETILKQDSKAVDQEAGMECIMKCFYETEEYQSAADVCQKFIARFPTSPKIPSMQKILHIATEKAAAMEKDTKFAPAGTNASGLLKQFDLPVFKRFAKTYTDGQVIISEFEPGDTFYFIQRGAVQISKYINGTLKKLDVLTAGNFFGEMAIIDNTPRSATIFASGSVTVLEFNKANFGALVTGNPQIALMLMKMFCKRIYDQRQRLNILMIKEQRVRIAAVFLMLDEMQENNPLVTGVERSFRATVADIAQWAGLPADQTKTEIEHYASRGQLKMGDNTIDVADIHEMQRVVEVYNKLHRNGAR